MYVKGLNILERYTEKNNLVVNPFVIIPKINEIKEINTKDSITGELNLILKDDIDSPFTKSYSFSQILNHYIVIPPSLEP